jgi:hypothetical protein
LIPILAIGLLAVLILPQLLNRRSSSSLSNGDRATITRDALNLIDRGQGKRLAATGRYTEHIADLLPLEPRLAKDLAIGMTTEIDVSTNGKTYVAHVTSSVISLTRARTGGKVTARGCVVLKSGDGVSCPEIEKPAKPKSG